MINTAQNHGFAVDEDSLASQPARESATQVAAFDGTPAGYSYIKTDKTGVQLPHTGGEPARNMRRRFTTLSSLLSVTVSPRNNQ